MLSRRQKLILFKLFSLFSVVRAYNIFVIGLAQYLSAIFILSSKDSVRKTLLDPTLFLIVLASSLSIASGYIINNFYDSKKDLINRPKKSMIDRLVSQKTKLYVYFSINFLVVFIAFFISWRAFLFFSSYIFLIWFYSHKLKKYSIIGNFSAAILAILPFFAILMYYKNFYEVIFAHACFLFLLLLIREMIKDLENIKGDLVQNYQTIPIVYGEKVAKIFISILTISTLVPIYILIEYFDIGMMDIYFNISMLGLIFFGYKLNNSKTKKDYIKLHFLLKLIILLGVVSIVLIKF
jgi:4-hydroxybenzoate polyprenyltransferase